MNTVTRMYVGTWPRAHRTDPEDIALGIYTLDVDQGSAVLFPTGMTPTRWPGWVAMHPDGGSLYAVNEVDDHEGINGGAVTAFAINSSGGLAQLNQQRTGAAPAHCVVDSTGRYLLVASYSGGTVHMFPIGQDGQLGEAVATHRHKGSSVVPKRQDRPRPHSVNPDPANRFVLVPDLGTDSIVVYELDADIGTLDPRPELTVRVAPGSGPRHVAFHPQGTHVYLVNEIAASITVFEYDGGTGRLQEIQTESALPGDFSGFRSGAEIAVDPAGRFVYASTRSRGSKAEPAERGLDSIVWFRIGKDGRLTLCGRVHSGGEMPRNFIIEPAGDLLYAAHQGSSTIVTFRLEPETGEPVPTGEVLNTPAPVCLQLAVAHRSTAG